ncbi:hypothetical protein WA171_003305 [Blastocystis sp. BT1]
MELFGFQNENEALFTSFVELLDNCVDAVISNTSIDREEKEINICLTPSKSGGTYCFSTVDNGIGMTGDSIPSLCGGMFSTSKGDSQSQTIGKYGVGLKAILLFYHATLTVSSSTRNEDCVTSYRLCLDPIGDRCSPLTVLKRKSVLKPEQLKSSLSGTQITIDSIKGDDSILYHQVEEYFHRLIALFPPFHLHIQITSHSSLEYHPPHLCSNRLFSFHEIGFASSREFSSTFHEESFDIDCFTLLLPTSSPIATEVRHQDDHASILLLRYVNYKPLLADSGGCGITKGFLQYSHWARYGYSLRWHDDSIRKGVTVIDGRGMNSKDVSERDLLVFVFHVQTRDRVRFSSLKKSALVESDRLKKGIKHCVTEVMNDVQRQFPTQFISKRQSKQLYIFRDVIPSVANSVTNLLSLMDPEKRQQCLSVLSLSSDSLSSVENHLIDSMNSILAKPIEDAKRRKRDNETT